MILMHTVLIFFLVESVDSHGAHIFYVSSHQLVVAGSLVLERFQALSTKL